ncbi:hypothetical protein FRC18_007298, partial [Serendipita sp. 400]
MLLARLYKTAIKRRQEAKTQTRQSKTTLAIQTTSMQDSSFTADSTGVSTNIEHNAEPTPEPPTELESIAEHPIQRCNQDILSTIFEWFTCDHMTHRNRRAAQLTMVCRRWRQVALQTPELWRRFDIGLGYPLPTIRKQWDWLVSMRPAAPDDIRVDCIQPGYPDQPALIYLWSQCGISTLERITHLEFVLLRSSTAAGIAHPAIALPDTRIDRLWVDSHEYPGRSTTHAPWEVDQLLETFPHVRYIKLLRQSCFSFRPGNAFLHTTFLHITNCVNVSICAGLSSFVNLERLWIQATTISEGSASSTTTIRMPSLKWLCIYRATNFPWTKLDCPSLQVLTGEESVSDAIIRFLRQHPHVRDIDVQVDKQMFATFARTVPHVETLDLGGYIEGLVEWQTTTDLVEPPFPNVRRLILDRTEEEIGLDLFESI